MVTHQTPKNLQYVLFMFEMTNECRVIQKLLVIKEICS